MFSCNARQRMARALRGEETDRPALAYLPGFERIDSHTIGYTAKDIIEVSKALGFVLDYRVDLQP